VDAARCSRDPATAQAKAATHFVSIFNHARVVDVAPKGARRTGDQEQKEEPDSAVAQSPTVDRLTLSEDPLRPPGALPTQRGPRCLGS
jgi:hypothetical protein